MTHLVLWHPSFCWENKYYKIYVVTTPTGTTKLVSSLDRDGNDGEKSCTSWRNSRYLDVTNLSVSVKLKQWRYIISLTQA